jgi:DNA-dependent RNA polymerase auxiliary subunit epsilon
MKPILSKSKFVSALFAAIATLPLALAQQPREWTNMEGKKITAEYLGHREADVALKLSDGKIVFVPAIKLSTPDNAFLKENHKIYMPPWATWSEASRMPIRAINVSEELIKEGGAYYTTEHFRFHCDVNLGPTLMKDIATVFELTYHLHKNSPLGLLAAPDEKYFPARLLGKLTDYHQQGGPRNSAGVYMPKEKVFLAPLELMGMESGTAGWKKVRREYDPSTIVHELSHMLTHDILNNLPVWVNEGYAEYICHIPIKNDAFQTDKGPMREAIRDMFFDYHVKASTRNESKPPKFSNSDKSNYLASSNVPDLYKVSKVLTMTDEEWATGRPPAPKPQINNQSGNAGGNGTIVPPTTMGFGFAPPGQLPRLARLYHTAHLIIFYYLEIEGEKGVTKIRKFLEKNRTQIKIYEKYREDFKTYEKEWAAFTALPDVKKVDGNRIEYPSHLTPPKAPDEPNIDQNFMNLHGLSELLDGESAEVVGDRIEKALIKELEINFDFRP